MDAGAVVAAVNWSEVAQKVLQHRKDWTAAQALILSYDVTIEPVVEIDAEWAAARWRRGERFSLGDRLCLAVGNRLDVDVLTADIDWGTDGRIRQIR